MVRRRTCAVSNHEAPPSTFETRASALPRWAQERSSGDEDPFRSLRSIIMEIGFIGLGKMGTPMARRLIEAGHQLTVFDTNKAAVDKFTALGAQAASSPRDIA